MLFIEYPKCTTCQKAKKWLEQNNINFENRHIIEQKPSKEELKEWIKKSDLDIKKWFNTTGIKYRSLGLKDKLDNMTDEEKIEILASDGMLIKRPIVVTNNWAYAGFRVKQWDEKLRE